MTADAKIGLLLGLVFIVVIAFLINGLPNFFKARQNEEEIVYDVPAPGPNVRIPIPLNPSVNRDPGVPFRESSPPKKTETFEIPAAVAKTDTPAKTETTHTDKKSDDRKTTYTVKPGDTVAAIAKKHYGPEIGNKNATLELIAKKNKLDSKFTIRVDQVIEIPSLKTQGSDDKKQSVIPAGALVKNIADGFNKLINNKKMVEYVVKSGDCLSMISAENLGTCKRVDEIIKLNKDIIDDADDIEKGMVLKLPQK